MKNFILLPLLLCILYTSAQRRQDIYEQSAQYEYPTDPLVRQKLEQWQDQKFGIFLHWGIYSVEGIPESWTICGEPWPKRDSTIPYDAYKKWYWELAGKFNPVKFDPEQWAAISQNAGARYLVFTTKHHDGFNMFDTKQSDYKITGGPFKDNPRADVTKYIFEAYRKRGMMIGAYFSKPDWHHEDFWWPRFPTPTRHTNYNTQQYPWRWQRFKEFTYNQLSELMHGYGPIDILWLDGGWIRPPLKSELERAEWGLNPRGRANQPNYPQDIDIPRIAKMARTAQPGILMVDRTIHGPYENYRTPEQSVPGEQIATPWETCITLTRSWSYRKDEKAKSAAWVIHTLAEVVAKGGNMLLGFGPTPEGLFPLEVLAPLDTVGKWLRQNGAAIYNTRITAHYRDGATWFTQSKDGKTRYAIVCIAEGTTVPATLQWKGNLPARNVTLLATGKNLPWKKENDTVIITLPKSIVGTHTAALTLRF